MKILIILIHVLSLISTSVIAKVDIFNPYQNQDIRDLVFDVTSPNLDELLQKKLMLSKKQEFRLRVYWRKEQALECEIVDSISEIDSNLLLEIKNDLFTKISQLMLSDVYEKVAGYKKIKVQNNKNRYVDQTGLSEIEEAVIEENIENVKILIKKSNEEIDTTYSIKKYKWSDNRPVIYSVKKIIENKLQETIVDTEVSFEKSGNYWLPSSLNSKIKQNLRVSPIDKYKTERILSELLVFQNYKINQNMALKWFAKQK